MGNKIFGDMGLALLFILMGCLIIVIFLSSKPVISDNKPLLSYSCDEIRQAIFLNDNLYDHTEEVKLLWIISETRQVYSISDMENHYLIRCIDHTNKG